jgi:Fe-S-cluster containining protein
MRFDPIPERYFARFHETFRGDTPETFRVCSKCGGACEFNKIGTLMPGEREYMASMLGLSVAEFSERYLDVIVMDDGMELDVLKLINGCPFECNCRHFKVVLCEIYPVAFQVLGDRVQFGVDDWCPLADTFRFRRHFLQVGVAAVSRLPVPVEWYRHVARYDELHFDYVALEAARKDRLRLETFTFAELLSFQRAGLENDPRQRFHPYPDEVLPYQEPIIPGIVPSGEPGEGRGLDRRG